MTVTHHRRPTDYSPPPAAADSTQPLEENPTRNVSADRLTRSERRQQVLQMRKEGSSLYEISKKFRVSRERVWDILHEAITELNRISQETRDDLVRLEIERCESIFSELYPHRRVPRVAEVLLKVMDRKAKYLGLDSPLKVEQSIVLEDMTDEEMHTEARRIGLDLTEFTAVPGSLPGLPEGSSSQLLLPSLSESFAVVEPASMTPVSPPSSCPLSISPSESRDCHD